jgi:putative transposase
MFGACRFVYNGALRLRTDAFARGEKITYEKTSSALTLLKKQPEYSWLNEVSCVPTQQTLRNLQTAFKNFFEGRTSYPTFKKKWDGHQSAEYTKSAFKWDPDTHSLTMARIGRLAVRWSRTFTSDPTTATITKSPNGRYHVTLVLDEPIPALPPSDSTVDTAIGIDLGINRLATLSNGERIPNPRHLPQSLDKLAKAQRTLSRRQKGSGRWNRQKQVVARLMGHIADSRRDYLHKVTTDLVRRFDTLAIEDLNVRGMVRNHCLARAISDVGFGMFAQFLTYKCAWYGRVLLQVDRFFPSSKRCFDCGHVVQSLPLDIRQWSCPACQVLHDRDENAARNILAVGHRLAVGHTGTARGGSVSPLPGQPGAAVAVET